LPWIYHQCAAFRTTSRFVGGSVLASARVSDWISSGTSLAWMSPDCVFVISRPNIKPDAESKQSQAMGRQTETVSEGPTLSEVIGRVTRRGEVLSVSSLGVSHWSER
jgi:hypothetical protein